MKTEVDKNRELLKKLKQKKADKLQALMDDISAWADATFGAERKTVAPLHHLKKEAAEAIEAIERAEPNRSTAGVLELADCFILVLNACALYGLTASEVIRAANYKLETCKKRKWGEPDENGVVEHIRDQA